MKRSPLTGVTEGVFDSLLIRVPPNTGQLVEVATLVAGNAYDDTELALDVTELAASVAVNSASTAANSANIASHTSTLAQHASDISGKANASDLQTPVPAGAVFSDTPLDVWHSGSSQYIPTTKVYYENSSLTLDAGAGSPTLGAWFVKAEPSIADVSGLQAVLNGKQAALSNAAYLDATSSVQGQLNAKQATLSNAAYLDATSSVQTQLNGKQASLSNAAFLDATSSVQGQLATKAGAVATTAELGLRYTKIEVDANTYTRTQVNDRLNDKADTATTYTTSEIDSNTYTRAQVDDRLNDKADTATSYTASEIDSNTYTRAQVDDRLDDKADSSDLLQVYAGSNTWAEPTKMYFDNSTLALDVAPGSATLGAWIVDPTPHWTSVVGLSSELSGKQPSITNTLTLGSAAPTLTLTRGSTSTDFYVDGGMSSVINWDVFSSGSTYFGIKHSGSWQTWLTSSSSSWTSSSDARLKNVLGPIEGMCEKLKSVQPVFFEFKADPIKAKRAGLLAQEVKAICPEIVSTDPEGNLGMAYGDAVPLLLASIRELVGRVEALEALQSKKSRTRSGPSASR